MQERPVTGSLEVRREGLLARLESARPKIVALTAPAGFGKSTLVAQYLAGRGAFGTCDCGGVQNDLDLARRVLRALAQESPARERSLARCELMLGDGGSTVAERIGPVLEAWREPSAGTVVFEHAENAESSPARGFFATLLGSLPEGRSTILCARENLRSHLTRFAAPHEIVVLRAGDLAFDAVDVREIFAPERLDDASVERILSVSRGWPVAVLLLRRFAAEGRIAPLLERLGDVAFEELHDYLIDRVLTSLGERLAAAIFACAAIPGATLADLRAALGDTTSVAELEAFAQESPFLTRDADGAFAVHPILASLLVGRDGERRGELLATVALRHEAENDFERAAELHLVRGDRDAAASALGKHEIAFDRSPSPAYVRALYALDGVQVLQYPRLWSVTCLRRMFCVDSATLLDEAESVWRMIRPETPAFERLYVVALRVLLMLETGRIDAAAATIEEFAGLALRGEAPDARVDASIAFLGALVAARSGRLGEAETVLSSALPALAGMDVPAFVTFLTLGAGVARPRGERALERQFLDRAIEFAQRSNLGNAIALALAEASFGAWLADEDAAVVQLSGELEQWVDRCGATGLAYYAAVLAGKDVQPGRADSARYVAFARMIAAARAVDDADAARHAREGALAASAHRAPFLETLAHLAVAFCDPGEFDEAAARAAASAARCESPALHDAVAAIARREARCGFLRPFAERFSHARRERVAPLDVELVAGSVRVRGREVRLSGREAELLFALASRRDPTSRSHLAALLWPEIDEGSARNALSVCLHRLRRNVGAAAVLREGDGYRLCDGARVDVWEIERRLGSVRSRGRLDDADREAFARVADRLGALRPARMERWEWFEPVARRLDALRVDVTHRLGADALERGDANGALVRAQEILARDPFDEPAREMAIRAHLALDDRAGAMRNYRQYREILLAELQCEPSPALTRMLYS